ncbi:LOW QUALITY PROTEIN: hypothetical protein ElyMa_006970100 [Elysia marginata]|uniref:Uncharacterized protein n=1 Tax=Elysia marginata TaxID=1093978 RepID=A0AAV4JK96_9GAST|nr:LOW QUALITY PROTEIN: hypothetical protein ElyMa_006970100 [Elysia marginata]
MINNRNPTSGRRKKIADTAVDDGGGGGMPGRQPQEEEQRPTQNLSAASEAVDWSGTVANSCGCGYSDHQKPTKSVE